MSILIFHPLMEQAVPRVSDILERCAPEARQVVEAACRLANYRSSAEDEILAPPLLEPILSRTDHWRGLSRTDLCRALLATHPDRLQQAVLGDRAAPHFRQDSARLGDLVARLPAGRGPDELIRPWAREWACFLRDRADSPLEIEDLIRSLGEAGVQALARYAPEYVSGEVSATENFFTALTRAERLGLFRPVPPAYYDRHGGLAALDDAASRAGAVVVLGEARTGRSSLLRVWIARAVAGRRHASGGGMSFVFGPLYRAAVPAWESIESGAGRWVFAWTGNIHDGAAWDFTRSDAGRFAADTIGRLLDLSLRHPKRIRLIITATEEELNRLSYSRSEVHFAARVLVPPPDDTDLLPIWLCQAPALNVGLPDVLRAFEIADEAARRCVDDDALELAQHLHSETGRRRWADLIQRCERLERSEVRPGSDPWPIDRSRQRLLARYLGSEERLWDLVRLLEPTL
jgi:hypothetical protein